MAVLEFTQNLRRHVACPTEAVAGGTLAAALEDYFARHPQVRGYVLDEQGRLRHHVTLFIDGEQLRARDRLDTPIADHSTVSVMQALSGG
jgi:molybdopterin synthase sulfur carrier subunit